MTDTTNTEKPELVQVQDIHTFIALTARWHSNKVAVLEHMLNVPEGTTIQSNGGSEIALEGAMLDGFKAGLGLALMELGQLPFVTESDAVPAQH